MAIKLTDPSAHIPERTLYTHATIVTVNAAREVIIDGAILIDGSKIARIGRTDELLSELEADRVSGRVKVQNCGGQIIIPGLINTHAHLAQSLLRGLAENLNLHSWLCDAIWPLEANYQDDDGYVAATLTIAEMLKSGTTTFLEAMLTHTTGIENAVRAVQETGVRACLGKLVKAIESNPSLSLRDARDKDWKEMSIEAALQAHENFNGAFDDRLRIWMACGTPRGSPITAHEGIGKTAEERSIGLTMHCAEAPKDLEIFRDVYGCSPMQFCAKTKIASPRTILAHMVHPDVDAGDFAIMRSSGTTISHNPTSNCKLGSGVSPIPDMIRAGVQVSLGTDGAPCNNTYDMFREMHLATLIHSGVRQEAHLLDSMVALEMATINGAKALGLEHDIGSLEVGKKADLVFVQPTGLHCAPWNPLQAGKGGMDPVSLLVHCCTGSDVTTVVVNGQTVVRNKTLIHINEQELMQKAVLTASRIQTRAGISNKSGLKLNYI